MDLSDIVSIARPNLWEGQGHLPGFTINIFCIADTKMCDEKSFSFQRGKIFLRIMNQS